MPRRRRRADEAETFSFVVSDGLLDDRRDVDAPDGLGARPRHDPDAGDTAQDEAPGTGRGARRRRTLVALVAGGAVVAGVLAVGTGAAHRAEERRVEAAGGLRPTTVEPHVAWTADVPVGDVVVQGTTLLTIDTGDDGNRGGTVVATDARTGAQRWTAQVGDRPRCSTDYPVSTIDPTDPLVCVADDGAVTVLDAAGRTLAHREGAGPGVESPAPHGTLLRAVRTGRPTAEAFVAAGVQVPPGRDARVVVTDAVTGQERWSAVVPFVQDPSATSWCLVPADGSQDDASPLPSVDVEWLSSLAWGGLLSVDGCGVQAIFSPGGDRLDEPAVEDMVLRRRDGTLLRSGSGAAPGTFAPVDPVLTAPDGSDPWPVEGTLLDPLATDVEPLPLLVSGDGSLRVIDDDGSARWVVDGSAYELVAATDDALVIDIGGTLAALDPGTGGERWSVDLDEAGEHRAFLDGEHVVLWTGDGGTGGSIAAYRLGDGSVAWTTRYREGWPVAVDGRLVLVAPGSLTGLG